MSDTHILKFLNRQQLETRQSKRFHPQQTFGHSRQAPDWFKRKFSLSGKGGYQYKFDDPKYHQVFKYSSQKNTFFVNKPQSKTIDVQVDSHKTINNRKKGLLSEYLDNNSWMKKVVPLTGFERGHQGRNFNNTDRQRNIQNIKMKKSTYIASKTGQNFHKSLNSKGQTRVINTSYGHRDQNLYQNPQHSILYTSRKQIESSRSSSTIIKNTKQQIRQQRNKMVELKLNKIHQIRKIQLNGNKFRSIDHQFVQKKLTQTIEDYGKGIHRIIPNKSIEMFDYIIGKNNKFKNKHQFNQHNQHNQDNEHTQHNEHSQYNQLDQHNKKNEQQQFDNPIFQSAQL